MTRYCDITRTTALHAEPAAALTRPVLGSNVGEQGGEAVANLRFLSFSFLHISPHGCLIMDE